MLVLGVRGSGKSTQSKNLAQDYNLFHCSSGDLARQGLDPLAELRDILTKEFSKETRSSQGKYNGLVLDRFVAASAMDVYYLLALIEKFDLRLNLVIHLAVNADTGKERAAQRDNESKPKSDSRRLVEQHLLRDVNKNLFSGSGVLVDICDGSAEEVYHQIKAAVEETIAAPKRPVVVLPRGSLEDGSQLVTDYFLYKEVKHALHDTMGTPALKHDSFPGSQMTGQMTEDIWKKYFKQLPTYFVTLKADGKRVLMVKHKERIFVFPSKFTSMYELAAKNTPKVLHELTSSEADKNHNTGIHFAFDCEFVISLKTKKYSYFVFDYLFMNNKKATMVTLPERYKAIKELFGASSAWTNVFVKEFVPVCEIPKLLPALDDPELPFEIDGLVFQHSGFYRVPQDKQVFKWKPREMCSVDFRLCNGRYYMDADGDERWAFDLATLAVGADGVKDERPYKDATLDVSDSEAQKFGLANGVVVEAVKTPLKRNRPKPVEEVEEASPTYWTFLRVRTDKMYPNSEETAIFIDTMKHWSLEDLKKACQHVKPMN